MGFVQVRLEVVAINISNMAAFVRAGQTSLNITSYYLPLSKATQRLRADGILMPHLLQSPNVSGYFTETPYNATITINHIYFDSFKFLLTKVGHYNY